MTVAADIAGLSFEQALAELEKIVAELESGQAPLERSIEVYERGAALKAHCEKKLEAARLRVEGPCLDIADLAGCVERRKGRSDTGSVWQTAGAAKSLTARVGTDVVGV